MRFLLESTAAQLACVFQQALIIAMHLGQPREIGIFDVPS